MFSKSLRALVRELAIFGPPTEAQGDHDKYVCPYHPNDTNGSLAVYEDGHAHCFGCNTSLQRKQVAALVNKAQGGEELTSSEPFASHPRLGTPERVWFYRDQFGIPTYAVYRFGQVEADGSIGKTSRIATIDPGTGEWRWGGLQANGRNLYNLDHITNYPTYDIVVCEGEKAADAALQAQVPGVVVTTSMNGTNSASATDWTPCQGRRVFIWPDNDAPGLGYVENVINQLVGAASIRVLDVSAFPPKSDAADFDITNVRRILSEREAWEARTVPAQSILSKIGGSAKAMAVYSAFKQGFKPKMFSDLQGRHYCISASGPFADAAVEVGSTMWETYIDHACSRVGYPIGANDRQAIERQARVDAECSDEMRVFRRAGLTDEAVLIRDSMTTALVATGGVLERKRLSELDVMFNTPVNMAAAFKVATPARQSFRQYMDEFFTTVPEVMHPVLAAYIALAPTISAVASPALYFIGGAGSGKTTIAHCVKQLIDPEHGGICSLPSKMSDLQLLLSVRDCVLLDNLGRIPPDVSNFLCTAITSGEVIVRRLYTTTDICRLNVRTNLIMTSVMTENRHQDLLDRCLLIQMDRLTYGEDFASFGARFDAALPEMRCYALSAGSRVWSERHTLPPAQGDGTFRFGVWRTMARKAAHYLGYSFEEFDAGIGANTDTVREEVEMTSRFVPLVAALVETSAGKVWAGSAKELLQRLFSGIPAEERTSLEQFPKNEEQIGRYLRANGNVLAARGVVVEFSRSKTSRKIVLKKRA